MASIWKSVKDRMWSMTKKEVQLGLGEKGVTKYWSSNCNKVRLEYYRIYCNFFNVKWSTIVNYYTQVTDTEIAEA